MGCPPWTTSIDSAGGRGPHPTQGAANQRPCSGQRLLARQGAQRVERGRECVDDALVAYRRVDFDLVRPHLELGCDAPAGGLCDRRRFRSPELEPRKLLHSAPFEIEAIARPATPRHHPATRFDDLRAYPRHGASFATEGSRPPQRVASATCNGLACFGRRGSLRHAVRRSLLDDEDLSTVRLEGRVAVG